MKEDYTGNINDNELKIFLAKTKSKIWIDSKEEEILVDFTWLEKVEECLPYLDKILRSPKRFLVQEEEIIEVEKAKKTTPETIRHLAQNSNLIQDIADDGMVQPKKVLNITKEDTIDIYENRFIFTLIKNLSKFLDMQIEEFGDEGSYFKCDRKVSFEGETKLRFDNIKVNLTLENQRMHEIPIPEEGQSSRQERIQEVKKIISGFSKTEFIKALVQVAPVRSPIRKTNIILKEPNFKKAAELWDYLEQFQIEQPKITRKNEIITDNESIKDQFDFGYFIDFDSLSMLDTKYSRKKSNLYNVAYIKNLIEDYLDEVGGSERVFTRMLKEQFKLVSKLRRGREKKIKKICYKFIQIQNENFDKCEALLK